MSLILLLLGSLHVHAQSSAITIDPQFIERKIGLDLVILEDTSAQLGIDQVRSIAVTTQFKPSTQASPSFGYTNSAYWARFTLNDLRPKHDANAHDPLYLTLAYAQTDFAELWCTDANSQTVVQQRTGDHVPRAEWPTSYREPAFKIAPAASTCWLRVQSSASMQFPLTLYSEPAFMNMRLSDNALQALYFGALLVMIAYNGLVALTTFSWAYGIYTLFLVSYGLFQCAFGGVGFQLLWPNAIGWADTGVPFFILCLGLSSSFFAINLLDLRRTAHRFYQLGQLTLCLLSINLVSIFFLQYSTQIRLLFGIFPFWAVFLLGSGIYLSKKGVRTAKIYLAAWFFFITGTLVIMASRMGWLPVNSFTANATQIGSVIEFVLLSIALADRIKSMQKSLLDAKEKIADTLRASEQQLNQKVKERTAALEAANSEILNAYTKAEELRHRAEEARTQTEIAHNQVAQALTELQTTQSQLVASEKMASLGLLVSNVAHEINTPISAIQSSGVTVAESMAATLANMPRLLDSLSREQRSLFLQLITQSSGNDILFSSREERQLTKQVTSFLESAGIDGAIRKARLIVKLRAHTSAADYLPLFTNPESDLILNVANGVADVQAGTSNIIFAAAKIARMVASLKELSGNDRITSMFENPVHKSIEKALSALESKLHDIDVVRNYQDIAPLYCDPEALQQVWMHLINNALYASNHQGVILIGMRAFDNQVEVRIADFGSGIAPDIKDRIFEPFFTTRTSGEGGGMGLSIAKKIVESHKGRIEVQTEAGAGTTFTVILPYAA